MKKIFLIITAGILSLAACNSDTKTTTSDDKKMSDEKMSSSTEDKEERNKKIVLVSVEAFNSHNPDAVLKDVTPDGLDYGDGSGPVVKGVDSIKAGMKAYMDAFPDVKGENLMAVADGDWVVVWGDWSGTFKNEMMGMKPTGKSFKYRDADIFKLNDDGKIIEHYSTQQHMTCMIQVGAKMPK
jgi:predicted ester cyclase